MSQPVPDRECLERLVEAACEGDPDELVEVVRRWPDAVHRFHRRLIDADVLWPWDLMRGMDDRTGEYLVDLIERGEGKRDRLIAALATGASPAGIAAPRRWNAAPPDWTA